VIEVRWTPQAADDLQAIYDFIARDSPHYAQLRVEDILAAIDRLDGTVGEVKIVQGLGYGLDEKAAEAARQMIFLTAVKDRKFVSFRMPMTMSIATRRTYP
jgi:hypothetical protein